MLEAAKVLLVGHVAIHHHVGVESGPCRLRDDHPTAPQSLVDAAIGRGHGAGCRMHVPPLLECARLFKPESGSLSAYRIRPVILRMPLIHPECD